MKGYLKDFCLLKSTGFAHLVAQGLVSMMLRHVTVKIVAQGCIDRLYRDAQNRMLWRSKTCPACT